MSWFKRKRRAAGHATTPAQPPPAESLHAEGRVEPGLAETALALGVPEPGPETEIIVSRTLVKSEPELAALVASEPDLATEGVQVSLSEKGFGTRVAIRASAPSELSEADLERLLDGLAEPQKRPFTNS
jgi:hypothetical protein